MAYNGKYVHGMGITLVVLGSLNIILGIGADVAFGVLGANTIFHYVSAPIWNGIVVVITGILGICSGRTPSSKGLMVAFMVMALFTSILFALSCLSLAIVGALVAGEDSCHLGPYSYDECVAASIAMHSVNAVLAFAEIVMGFTGAIMSCCGLASPSTDDTHTVVYCQAPNMPLGQGQGAYIISQTGMTPQGVPYVTASGGAPQQQAFIRYYGTMGPPPYMPQFTPNATTGNTPAVPPVETKGQPSV